MAAWLVQAVGAWSGGGGRNPFRVGGVRAVPRVALVPRATLGFGAEALWASGTGESGAWSMELGALELGALELGALEQWIGG